MLRILLIPLLLIGNVSAFACQYTANSHELASAKESRNRMQELAADLANKSDAIFVADISEIGADYIIFEDVVNLKGSTEEMTRLSYPVLQDIIIGCGGLVSYSTVQIPKKVGPESYLVYSASGEITRLNHVGSFAPAPSGHEEIDWLEESDHITNSSN